MGPQDEIQLFLDTFGKRVKELRNQKGLTQHDLADRSYMDIRQIQRIEAGDINTSIWNAHLIAEGLEVPIDKLFLNKLEDSQSTPPQSD
ncbi:MAG: helix-turn-helix transcriptional regulator [Bacteroidia bacterium]|nr:helix-turn-helix transcriptional regulator [Bacteroidia bacterium]